MQLHQLGGLLSGGPFCVSGASSCGCCVSVACLHVSPDEAGLDGGEPWQAGQVWLGVWGGDDCRDLGHWLGFARVVTAREVGRSFATSSTHGTCGLARCCMCLIALASAFRLGVESALDRPWSPCCAATTVPWPRNEATTWALADHRRRGWTRRASGDQRARCDLLPGHWAGGWSLAVESTESTGGGLWLGGGGVAAPGHGAPYGSVRGPCPVIGPCLTPCRPPGRAIRCATRSASAWAPGFALVGARPQRTGSLPDPTWGPEGVSLGLAGDGPRRRA